MKWNRRLRMLKHRTSTKAMKLFVTPLYHTVLIQSN